MFRGYDKIKKILIKIILRLKFWIIDVKKLE